MIDVWVPDEGKAPSLSIMKGCVIKGEQKGNISSGICLVLDNQEMRNNAVLHVKRSRCDQVEVDCVVPVYFIMPGFEEDLIP